MANIKPILIYDAYSNSDGSAIDEQISTCDEDASLKFESRFESGNLLRAYRLPGSDEYNLVLEPDYSAKNSHQLHGQWFYFRISNVRSGRRYKFNILNIGKCDGSFNQGMQPVMLGCSDNQASTDITSGIGPAGEDWLRTGSDVYLFKNAYFQLPAKPGGEPLPLGTLTFTLDFTTNTTTTTTTTDTTPLINNKTFYIASHFPYTYTFLQRFLNHLIRQQPNNTIKYLRRQLLCKTILGNRCDLLTITDFHSLLSSTVERPLIILTARVHPSESNSSYMMHGLLQFLTDPNNEQAAELRRRFIFKIVPMLNPDGVINGFHRHSLSGEDLNRQWSRPSRSQHPTVYWTKRLVEHLTTGPHTSKQIYLSCDFHGHSRKNNVFIYACPPPSSVDTNNSVHSVLERIFPRLWHAHASSGNSFDYAACTFAMEQSKEGTQRIEFHRRFGIRCSYTCESSFNGASIGDSKVPYHFTELLFFLIFD